MFCVLNNIVVVCVIVKLCRLVLVNFWVNINDLDMDIFGIVEYINLCFMDVYIVYVLFYMFGEYECYGDSDDVFVDKVCCYLCMINLQLGVDDFIDVWVSCYCYVQLICELGFLDWLLLCWLLVEGLWVVDILYYYFEDRGIFESIGFGCVMVCEVVV